MAIADQIENSLKEYKKLDENQLLIELGRQLDSIEKDLNSRDHLAAAVVPGVVPDNSKLAGPIGDQFKRIAWKFLNRFNNTLYSIMCDPKDPDYPKIHEAGKAGVEKLAFVLAGVLAANFGWLPALVVVLAALLIKRFAKDAYQEACELWLKEIQSVGA